MMKTEQFISISDMEINLSVRRKSLNLTAAVLNYLDHEFVLDFFTGLASDIESFDIFDPVNDQNAFDFMLNELKEKGIETKGYWHCGSNGERLDALQEIVNLIKQESE